MNINHPAVQTISSIFALVISVVAAIFAWEQVHISQDHNRLSVIPILQVTPYLEGNGGKNGLYLSNDGLGPAVMKSFSVTSGGMHAAGFGADRWREIVSTTSADPNCFATAWPKGETVLKPNSEVPLIILTKAEGTERCLTELIKLVGGPDIEIKIGYESIYREQKQLIAGSKVTSAILDSFYKALTAQR